jgi:hypothetical protein
MKTAQQTSKTIMNNHPGHLILRGNAVFLLAASAGGFVSDVRGTFFGLGPMARVVAEAPWSGLGFIEAHGLAFIIGILMWRSQASRSWHLAAAAIHVLLGTANLVFWQLFIVTDMLTVGYVTTVLHAAFIGLQSVAAVADTSRASLIGSSPEPHRSLQ